MLIGRMRKRPADACAGVNAARQKVAGTFAAEVLPIIRRLQASGITSLRGVAKALSDRRVKTAHGGAWTAVQVGDVLRAAMFRNPSPIAQLVIIANALGLLYFAGLVVWKLVRGDPETISRCREQQYPCLVEGARSQRTRRLASGLT
jgi:hypothetical protein